MRKIRSYLYGIILCLPLFAVMSCAGSSSKESQLTQEEEDSIVEALIESQQSTPSKSGAINAAQRFIREEFASNAEFIDEGTIVEETSVPGRYKVLQKFTAENHPSNWTKFIYRIWVQMFDDGTWEFGNLGIESTTGKSVLTTHGKMKEREQNDGVGDTITVAGITFKIAEKKPETIRIYTPKKLKRSQLRDVTKELMNQYSTIQFATDKRHERGDEYAGWTGNMFFDYDADEIIRKDNFLN